MKKIQQQTQQQALNILLNIKEDIQTISQVEPNKAGEDYKLRYTEMMENRSRKFFKKRKNQQQNQCCKKIILPRINNSKEELKLILKNLEQGDKCELTDIFSIIQDRPHQLKELDGNSSLQYRLFASKSNKLQSSYRKNIYNIRKDVVINRPKENLNTLSMMQKSDNALHYLLRKNNYSANELNIKALKILHAIKSNKLRCQTSLKEDKTLKLYNNIQHKKHIVGFLKKVC